MEEFVCEICKNKFNFDEEILKKHPNWRPRYCKEHWMKKNEGITGVFTDGGCRPNPGAGAWAVVWVENDQIKKELSGSEPDTTNNRMELTAFINGLEMVPAELEIDFYSDSELCCKTIKEWMPVWKSKGWTKKNGEIKNLDLVIKLDEIYSKRPNVRINWVKAHNGNHWNEYVDQLATSKIHNSF